MDTTGTSINPTTPRRTEALTTTETLATTTARRTKNVIITESVRRTVTVSTKETGMMKETSKTISRTTQADKIENSTTGSSLNKIVPREVHADKSSYAILILVALVVALVISICGVMFNNNIR
ncbi:hypothetical protein RF11_15979 [Thelohanellus kitauei]|uniref:Uncharacterized protein n=1 Tax=Thelohanellus kitauei TaxID=669202 RepID=A0A0C2MQ89_THEKT|nr:hypothetical protein RF11_15979 [Thelohanellus kitauei]